MLIEFWVKNLKITDSLEDLEYYQNRSTEIKKDRGA